MITLRLVDHKTGLTVAFVQSPILPPEEMFVLHLAEDVRREFRVYGTGDSVFSQDGVGGLVSLTEIEYFVGETVNSRIATAEREGRTDA